MTQTSNNPFLTPTGTTTVAQDPPQAEVTYTTLSPTGPTCPQRQLPAFPAELPLRPRPIHRGTFTSRLFAREPARNTDIEMGTFDVQPQFQSQSQLSSPRGWTAAFLGSERMTREERKGLIRYQILVATCLGAIFVCAVILVGIFSEYAWPKGV